MFDLMAAIRNKQKRKAPSTAETADSAETPQPRVLELAESLRKPADFSAGDSFSATLRKNPQAPIIGKPATIQGFRDLSANPQNPQTPEDKNGHNPDTLLLEIAQTLEANPTRLRALLSTDDMQDIAEGATSRSHLLKYFRLMRSDGHPLADEQALPIREPYSPTGDAECIRAWEPSHDCMIDHLMACEDCYGPGARYCIDGMNLRQAYLSSLYENERLPE
ncbi:MAG: hypothetical protein CMG91_12665 [Marinobacter sp.]|mgnify:CR=1 FL=1|nr:hypothetical protein [Marinobacter sp.]|tara:strand:+ start:1857 stop:2519 length:663 start_codon:yes stop_codon:yes gene_type:complete